MAAPVLSSSWSVDNGRILATTLLRHGRDTIAVVQSIAKTLELEARRTASMMAALEDRAGSPDTIN
jgi:hypothetical protein